MIENIGSTFRNTDMYQLQDECIKGVIVNNSENQICILFKSGHSLVLYNYYNNPMRLYGEKSTDDIVRKFISSIKAQKDEVNKTVQYAGLDEEEEVWD